jgi:hypothetical protein
MEPSLPTPPPGSVAGGPNSISATWDPVIGGLYSPDHMCAPQLCYVDDIQSWSTNEITVNWNSALSWVASFVADQGAGVPVQVAPAITQQPASVVPCGLTRAGLPVSLQIVGPMHGDALVLRAARAYESTREWRLPVVPTNVPR